jgi:hypothetical protein
MQCKRRVYELDPPLLPFVGTSAENPGTLDLRSEPYDHMMLLCVRKKSEGERIDPRGLGTQQFSAASPNQVIKINAYIMLKAASSLVATDSAAI